MTSQNDELFIGKFENDRKKVGWFVFEPPPPENRYNHKKIQIKLFLLVDWDILNEFST